jgi:hypothetical protein
MPLPTSATLRQLIVDNLNSITSLSIQLFLSQLVENKDAADTVPRYRIFNKATNTYILNYDELLAALLNSSVDIGYTYDMNMHYDPSIITPARVYITGLEINIDGPSDKYGALLTSKYGLGKKIIMLRMNYMADGDVALPLKIITIDLVSSNLSI